MKIFNATNLLGMQYRTCIANYIKINVDDFAVKYMYLEVDPLTLDYFFTVVVPGHSHGNILYRGKNFKTAITLYNDLVETEDPESQITQNQLDDKENFPDRYYHLIEDYIALVGSKSIYVIVLMKNQKVDVHYMVTKSWEGGSVYEGTDLHEAQKIYNME